MKKIYLNRKLFTIHSWLGLFLGILYTLISIGGASLVFYPELNQLLYGDEIKIALQPGKKITYNDMYKIAVKENPGAQYINLAYDPDYPQNAYSIYAFNPTPDKIFQNTTGKIQYLNPYNGNIILQANSAGAGDLLGFLNTLHYALYMGTGGAFIVTIMSIAVLISIITGFIFYRKNILKVLSFKVKVKFKNWRTASSDLHRVIGTWAFIFNVFIFGSGLYMEAAMLTPSWWQDNWPPQNTQIQIPAALPSLDSLVAKSKELAPDMIPSAVFIAFDTSHIISISGLTKDKLFLQANNYASVDFDWNGQHKETHNEKWADLSTVEKLDNINFSVFHSGWAFGLAGKIIWTIMGFAPAVLSISGFILWYRKKGSKRFRAL